MSINIVKGVEFGLGFEQTRRFGSAVHDVIEGRDDGGRWIHRTNNAGGLTGGVTNGEPLVVRGAVKPISTLARPLPSADLITGEAVDKAHYERSDISVVPAAGVVGRGDGHADARARSCSRSSAATRSTTSGPRSTTTGADRDRARGARRRRAARCGGRSSARPDRHGRSRLRRRRLRPAVDVVLVGLPGSGKSVVGRRLAHRHAAAFIDLDERIESRGRPLDRRRSSPTRARRASGPRARRDRRPRPGRSGAPTSGGSSRPAAAPSSIRATAGRSTAAGRAVWLDGRPEVLAQRLRRSPERPSARRPAATRSARSATWPTRRERFYAAARIPIACSPGSWRGRHGSSSTRVEGRCADARRSADAGGTVLLRADDADRADRARRRDRGRGARRGADDAPRAAGHPRQRAGRVGAVGERLGAGLARARLDGRARCCCRRARRPSGWR